MDEKEIRSMEAWHRQVKLLYHLCKMPLPCLRNSLLALLIVCANYSLHQLISVPEEKACTSMVRGWGVPSANSAAK